MLMGLLRNVPVIRLDGNGSRDRNRRIVRTGRTYGQKQGRISKMFDANGLHHYWDTSLTRFKEENDVDI